MYSRILTGSLAIASMSVSSALPAGDFGNGW
jgi:hypothetical protein